MKVKLQIILVAVILVFMVFPIRMIQAATLGDVANFIVDQNYDASSRSRLEGVLLKTTTHLYFYVEKDWWNSQTSFKQNEILNNFEIFSREFEDAIYPKLTSLFGSEARPGIDRDQKMTLFFHAMKEDAAGYVRESDGYLKLQLPTSNEREMMYLSLLNINNPQLKVFASHEFTHLIEFNQKNNLQGVTEETWLNEARADFSSTILGYDAVYEGSNLSRRVKDFLNSPSDSIIEWQDKKYDYAVVSLFMHYLVDHYGIVILADSLKSKSVGIASINEALVKNGVKENFSQIFTNWTITTLLNDCSINEEYCYFNRHLNNFRINPVLNFLPLAGSSSLSVTNLAKNWSGNWQKIIGGKGDLTITFSGPVGINFQIPYILFKKDNTYSVAFLKTDSNGKGKITIKNFSDNGSLVLLPSLQLTVVNPTVLEPVYPYTFTASITGEDSSSLPSESVNLCHSLDHNLYLGLGNSNEVRCLQQFLKNQGADIYPEGLVTGYFGNLTKLAAIRFQAKYTIFKTGFVGVLTRGKINQLLNAQ